jgi:hypothetical protein
VRISLPAPRSVRGELGSAEHSSEKDSDAVLTKKNNIRHISTETNKVKLCLLWLTFTHSFYCRSQTSCKMRNAPWIVLACLGLPIAAKEPPPARPSGKPEKMSDFKWADPFSSQKTESFKPSCEAEKAFQASEFLLDDLSAVPPLGLSPFSEALKTIFSGRSYPGSWDGIDPHGYDRNLLMMEYADVPVKAREWIEAQDADDGEGKGLFAVYDKPADVEQPVKSTVKFSKEGGANLGIRPLDKNRVVLFAPGALYDVLPLWVAETSDCEGKKEENSNHLR